MEFRMEGYRVSEFGKPMDWKRKVSPCGFWGKPVAFLVRCRAAGSVGKPVAFLVRCRAAGSGKPAALG